MSSWPTGLAALAGRRVRSLGLSRRAGYIVGSTRLTPSRHWLCIAAFETKVDLGGRKGIAVGAGTVSRTVIR